jgi:hypothetical protein
MMMSTNNNTTTQSTQSTDKPDHKMHLSGKEKEFLETAWNESSGESEDRIQQVIAEYRESRSKNPQRFVLVTRESIENTLEAARVKRLQKKHEDEKNRLEGENKAAIESEKKRINETEQQLRDIQNSVKALTAGSSKNILFTSKYEEHDAIFKKVVNIQEESRKFKDVESCGALVNKCCEILESLYLLLPEAKYCIEYRLQTRQPHYSEHFNHMINFLSPNSQTTDASTTSAAEGENDGKTNKRTRVSIAALELDHSLPLAEQVQAQKFAEYNDEEIASRFTKNKMKQLKGLHGKIENMAVQQDLYNRAKEAIHFKKHSSELTLFNPYRACQSSGSSCSGAFVDASSSTIQSTTTSFPVLPVNVTDQSTVSLPDILGNFSSSAPMVTESDPQMKQSSNTPNAKRRVQQLDEAITKSTSNLCHLLHERALLESYSDEIHACSGVSMLSPDIRNQSLVAVHNVSESIGILLNEIFVAAVPRKIFKSRRIDPTNRLPYEICPSKVVVKSDKEKESTILNNSDTDEA